MEALVGNSTREWLAFALVLGIWVTAFFHETLFLGKVLSPADVLRVSASFRDEDDAVFEPANRLLMDPVLQFQPWLEFNRRMVRSGQWPLWNPHAGGGAPHLANGQSAVFDPFHLLAYLGTLPSAYGWIAAGRLLAAGLGMFLLARSWGLGFWGRWFAGLVYPFCGFLVAWLLFPVTAVAVWMPWLFLAIDRVFRGPGRRSAGVLGAATALVILGGHIQTSAHVLLAGGAYAAWRWTGRRVGDFDRRRVLVAWTAGTLLGIGLAAVQVLPLAAYLSRSPVWGDRRRENPPWWAIARPRVLDAVCTALPYAYGSQRRGHPNLARALGVHNLNESAGGFVGMATLIWLAPLAVRARRRSPRVAFLAGMALFGALAAFRIPPVDNLLRACPVLDVTDNRRLTLWSAFGLTLLGGIGLDYLGRTRRLGNGWMLPWLVGGVTLLAMACGVRTLEPAIRARAVFHYQRTAEAGESAGADARLRADRQVRAALAFVPRYYGLSAAELLLLGALALRARRLGHNARWIRPVLLGLTLAELWMFGFGLNPAIERREYDHEPPVISRLREGLPPGSRALGVGEELPPNVLMRCGLSDVRNYDSVELENSVAWLDPIFVPSSAARTSRRDVTWASAIRQLDRLRESCVGAIVGATPPPVGAFDRIEQVGRVWIAWIEPRPWAECRAARSRVEWARSPGAARIRAHAPRPDRLLVRETYAPGWTALVDGRPAAIEPGSGPFFEIQVIPGDHEIVLDYDPPELRLGMGISACSLVAMILALTGSCRY
jgi:hypothetical protein